ncbi:ABC transporter ATP-binding protein [Pseudaquidulcibacter saccharophilus]|uniref:ABC transporter ATP-binding protein n=1 Tax=Pseudaquidulcibacter saccharophilus TaxID=2831900 RepID=UPI001EFF0101|nr:ABC transporter ATP-binding protein [Pseudaquidulcibacter saccharophilus]
MADNKGNPHSKIGMYRPILDMANYVYSNAKSKTIQVIFFIIANGVTENLSVFLLLPLLGVLSKNQIANGTSQTDNFSTVIAGHEFNFALWHILSFYFIVVLFGALLMRHRSIFMIELITDLVNKLRIDLFKSIANAKWSALGIYKNTDIEHKLNGEINRTHAAFASLLMIVQSSFFLFAYLVLSMIISVKMTLTAIVFGVIAFAIQSPFRKYTAKIGSKLSEEYSKQFRTIGDFLDGIKVTKSYNAENQFVGTFANNLATLKDITIDTTRVSSNGSMLSSAITAGFACIFTYVAYAIFHINFTKLLLLLLIFMRIAPRFSEIQNQIQNLLLNVAAFTEIISIIKYFESHKENINEDDNTEVVYNDRIIFKDLSFDYGAGTVLNNVNLNIMGGKITALIGPSGSGKSTFVDLLMGLMVPTKGEIIIDRMPLTPNLFKAWRTQVSYVPQDTFIMSASVRDNLLIAKPDATDEELEQALIKASANEFVDNLPNGIETKIGEGAIRLSGGERQRISISRALLRNPKLLILDEFTSALDVENTRKLTETIAQLKDDTSILLITHNHKLLDIADEVYEIENGNIKRQLQN